MEFNFDKVGKTFSETVKKKPVIIFAIVGCLAALVYLFIRARRSDDSGAVTLAAAPAETIGSIPGSGSTGSATDAQLYNDVYGLVKQVQEQTLGQVESMISQSQRDLYNVFDAELDNAISQSQRDLYNVFDAELDNAISNTDQTLKAYQDANQASIEAITKSINDSLAAITSKYDKLSGDQSEAAAAAQVVTVPATNDSITPAKEPSKTTTPAPAKTTTPAPAKTTTPAPATSSSYTGPSIVDYLKSIGKDSSYSARAQLAKELGISGYTGTAAQNTQMLNMLRNGSGTSSSGSGSKVSAGSSNTSSSAVQAALEAAKRAAGSGSSGGGGGRGGGGAF